MNGIGLIVIPRFNLPSLAAKLHHLVFFCVSVSSSELFDGHRVDEGWFWKVKGIAHLKQNTTKLR